MFHGQALQRGPVQEALVRANDDDTGEIAVMQDQAGRHCIAWKLKRQESAKRLAGAQRIGQQFFRRGDSAGLVAISLLVFELCVGVRRALRDSPGDAAHLDCRDPVVCSPSAPARRVGGGCRGERRGTPIVEASSLARGVVSAWKRERGADQDDRIEGQKYSQKARRAARGLPPPAYRGNEDADRHHQDEEHRGQEAQVEYGHFKKYFTMKSSVRQRLFCGEESSLREYNYLVRVKTSITLPADLLKRVDRADSNRSAFLERAALVYLARLEQFERDRKDVAIINRHARRLNREALDTLGYQMLP